MKHVYNKEVSAVNHWGFKVVTFLDLYKSEIDEKYYEVHERVMKDDGELGCRTLISDNKVATITNKSVTLHLKDLDLQMSVVKLWSDVKRFQWETVFVNIFTDFCHIVCPEFPSAVLKAAPSPDDVIFFLDVSKDELNWISAEYFAVFVKLWENGAMPHLSAAHREFLKNKK